MSVLIFSDGIFDLNEALIRVAVIIAIPLGIVAVGGAVYLISKAGKK
jgi:phage shock protein PspC (stress-responsive transcriptional regulator)